MYETKGVEEYITIILSNNEHNLAKVASEELKITIEEYFQYIAGRKVRILISQ